MGNESLQPEATNGPAPSPAPAAPVGGTRAAVIWTSTVVAVAVLILLVIFMVQNQDQVAVYFLGFQGQLALGVAMLIAAVGGAVVVSIAGAVRIIQLRARAHTANKARAKNGP
ncbi:DUF1049 domain-containing protein [Arthrobacter sp. AQ5-05]|uniref:LapA family protein n=1 Tax=Arthrobacter sp. AQ5-05 TaxID=2184581 RepID=UPI000DCF3B78|nr:lipopolysaccharide assembly protein LapA domain-containing protein [Arthrobacter sp. AQ5-05]RAX47333.1 DUF1049 domain-containing protein [Arthrobacter sp. AQ5-05]